MLIIPHNVADHASSLALLSFIDIRRTIGIRIQMTRSALVSWGLQPTLGVDRSPLHAPYLRVAMQLLYVGFYGFPSLVSVAFIAKWLPLTIKASLF